MKTARRSVVGTGPGLDANPSFPASALWSLISASNEDKLANHVAKSAERKPGIYPAELAKVCNLAGLPAQDVDDILRATAVNEVWGVRRKISAKLKAEGVEHVLQLAAADPAVMRRRWGVTLERTVRELQGQPCLDLDDAPGPKKQIACTRSFSHPIQDLASLVEAVSEFAAIPAVHRWK